MEYKVKLVQETREKIQLRHIKGLDIVENEVNRIMPNNLTGDQSKLDQEDEQTTIEQIKKDLENVEDVFVANVWSAGLGGIGGENPKIKNSADCGELGDDDEKPQPEVEWLATSSDEGDLNDEKNPDFDVSQDLTIQQLKKEKENLLNEVGGDQYQSVLIH